ncbi:VIR protein [Plasmodium vivax]|uniref:VIR protein n=1 Tax=Plasmodium vivax TaxID=5855 RepID=A0A1G4EEH9_PLAVI|nr:PIR protein [Plasmodium vivax]SCA60796.1 VIR protein [Plasmodium vivax]
MTNHCNGSHDQYLSYDCYNYLSEKLDAPKLSKENEVHLENALKFLGKEQYNKYNKYPKHKAIDNLAARITQDGLFYYSHNTKVACNYINYKLNETLRTHYNHIYTEDYNIFKKLVKEFYNKRHNSNNSQKPCENYIEHIDDEIYKKLNILYNIYYHYNELNRPNNYIYNNADHKLCSNLDLLIYYSNDAINRGLINEETISLIRKLKEIINNDDISKPYKQKCDLRVLYIMLTELPKTEVQITREANSELDLHVAQKPDELHELEPQRGDAVNEQASSQQESEDETSRDLAPQELVPQELAAKVEEPGIQLNGFQGVMYPAISQQVSYDQVVTGRPEERYISQDPEAPTRGTEGVLDKMQGFITETLGQVEPAPILGVSGGMGALFLLFKYTPVGTFFRGRRGRTYGIPSGFNGPFTGEFAGYQDYLGGNIGYSQMSHLAE